MNWFQRDRKKIANLLEIHLLLFSLNLQELFYKPLCSFYFLSRTNENHLSEVVREVVERMPKFFPVPRHLFNSDLAWVHLNLHLFDVVHHNFALTHLHKYGLHFDIF
jgi:hypothetical protein